MKQSNVIPFPTPAYSTANRHRVSYGGDAMEIKHTHPQHESADQRLEQLKALKKSCMVAVYRGKKTSQRQSA